MRETKWKYSAQDIFYLYSNLMSIYGFWPLTDDNLLLRIRITFAVFQMVFGVVAAVLRFTINCGNSDDSLDTILMMVCFTLVIAKGSLLYIHRNSLRYVIYAAVKDWNTIKDEKYRKMMSKRSNFSNTVTKLFYGMGMFSLISYIIKVLIFDEVYVIDKKSENGTSLILQPKYVLPGGCLFNDFGSFIYYFAVISQTIQLSVTCSINLGGDALYCAITAHVCEQCEILKLELRKFGEHETLEENHHHLRILIARHQHLMILAEKLEIVYNEIIFMQMFMSVLLISITGFGFLLSLNDGDVVGVTKCFGVMQFMLLQSYIYTFPADELKDQAEGLLRSFYWSKWWDMPAYIMKDIVFIMMRMNIPPYFTAGKIFYMTRQSYMTVIKTAASYLSVLRIMIK